MLKSNAIEQFQISRALLVNVPTPKDVFGYSLATQTYRASVKRHTFGQFNG